MDVGAVKGGRNGVRTLKDMYTKIREDGWQKKKDALKFSCQEVAIGADRDEVAEGFFTAFCENGQSVEGYVFCDEERMECTTPCFSGVCENIGYRFDSHGMREGEEREGTFQIVSDAGEYELPFRVSIARKGITCSEGPMENLFQFTSLARTKWQEAVKLFYSPQFVRLFDGVDRKFLGLYRGLSRITGNEQNVEEFLVSVQKKQPVEYVLATRDVVVNLYPAGVEENQRCETLKIMQSGWGYTRLRVETVGDFLFTEKKVLREDDFLGNQCSLPVFINPDLLHGGKNFGKVIFRHGGGKLEANLTVIKNREHRMGKGSRRHEMKKMTVELVRLYQDYKMKKINAGMWRAQTTEVVERMRRLDDRAAAAKLFQAQLLMTGESYEEAGKLLEGLEVDLDKNGPEMYCYYLYLSSLYHQDDGFTTEVLMQVEDLYRIYPDSWRIAWLLLFLSPVLRRSVSRKWQFLEEQFRHSGTSPVLYLEALHLANMSPTLLLKLDTYEIQLLHFGAKNRILSDDLVGHVAYLAGREKYYRESLYRILAACYERKKDTHTLYAVCTLLIKGNKQGSAYYEWYRRGVEEELRVTRLYEYYMMSVDLEKEVEIPRNVLMYFAYQSNLDQDRCAYLYSYILKHKDEMPELYGAYKGQIDRFILQQLHKGRMDRHLAWLYENMLDERMFTKDNCQALAPLVFLQELECGGEDIRRVVVIHSRLRGEQVCPVENKRACVALFDRDHEILLEDEVHNRYCAGRTYTLSPLLNPAKCLKVLGGDVGHVLGYDLFCCGGRKGKFHVNRHNAARFRYLASSEQVAPAFARKMRMALLRYYYEKEEPEELDLLLEDLHRGDVEDGDVYEAAHILIQRSFYEKAYEWLEGTDPGKMDEKALLRLCSRLLESGLHERERRMTLLCAHVFSRGKYDSHVLSHLVTYREGVSRNLLEVRDAAENFAVDTYPLTERLLVQFLFIGDNVMERTGMFRRYLMEGGRSDVEASFLHRCCGLYLMDGVKMDAYVLRDVARAAARGERLSDMCRLSYLEYYSRYRDVRRPKTDEVIKKFGEELIRKDMKLPLFQEYVDVLEGAQAMMDKTMVVYKGDQDRPVTIHYRIFKAAHLEEPLCSMEMQHIYAGIYTAAFVLFAGESLEYFITETAAQDGVRLDGGELRIADGNVLGAGSRYGLLNRIASCWLAGEKGEAQEQLEGYLYTEWMADGLFKPLDTDGINRG